MMMQQKVIGGANKLIELLFNSDFIDTSPLNNAPYTSAGAQAVIGGKCVFSANGGSIGLRYSPIGTINPYALCFSDGTKDLPFTYSADFNLTSWNQNNYNILAANFTSNTNGNKIWGISFSTTTIEVQLCNYNDYNQRIYKLFTFSISLSTDYNIRVTYDASGAIGGIRLWINNSEITAYTNSSVGTYTRMSRSSQEVNFGGLYFASNYDFRGTMDNIIIYDAVV